MYVTLYPNHRSELLSLLYFRKLERLNPWLNLFVTASTKEVTECLAELAVSLEESVLSVERLWRTL